MTTIAVTVVLMYDLNRRIYLLINLLKITQKGKKTLICVDTF